MMTASCCLYQTRLQGGKGVAAAALAVAVQTLPQSVQSLRRGSTTTEQARTLAKDGAAGGGVVGGDGGAAGGVGDAQRLDSVVVGARLGARAPRKHLGHPVAGSHGCKDAMRASRWDEALVQREDQRRPGSPVLFVQPTMKRVCALAGACTSMTQW